MTIHELNDIIKAESKFIKIGNTYTTIFKTGKFDFHDYGTGLLQVTIFLKSANYSGLVAISTIDDGVWQSWGEPIDEEKALAIIKVFDKYNGLLPNEDQINNDLKQFGIWGQNTG
jgi:hypothetical protein